MKRLTRYCSLFLCFLLLFTAFSVSASAESVQIKQYEVTQQYYYLLNGSYLTSNNRLTFTPNNNVVETKELDNDFSASQVLNNMKLGCIYIYKYTDNSIILEQDKTYTVKLSNIYFSALFKEWIDPSAPTAKYVRNATPNFVEVTYNDGTVEAFTDFEVEHKANDPNQNVTFTVTPKEDVISIRTVFLADVTGNVTSNGYYPYTATTYCGEFSGDGSYQFKLEVESQEAGLLKSVIEWLKGIKDGITNLFDGITQGFSNLLNGITNVFNSILELPSKLWGLISDGLKSLFVPSEDFIVDFKSDIDTMLEDKLGAVYQVVNILTESWDSITANDQQNTITIPQTTINLPQNNKFSFGGTNVQIVPSGFEWLADTIKTLVGIVCTILFVNGLRKKYDEVMGVEQ